MELLTYYIADGCINASAAYRETTVEIDTLKTNFDCLVEK